MHNAEVHAAASAEDFAPNRTVNRIRIPFGMRLGEGDAHLHRAAGMNRVQMTEQLLPHRHAVDHVIEDIAQILFSAHLIQALAVALAVRRRDLQRGMHQKVRDMHLIGAAVDLLPGDLRQPRHLRVSLERRLLFGDRQHRAQVLIARLDALRDERGGDIGGPTLTVAGIGRDQRHQSRFDVGGARRRRGGGCFAGTARQRQQRGQAQQTEGLRVA
ncbi:Uncharacterised protein [Acinetobacter baumannii]|nr:Uncharacterised protein [Acinetobacter baumannii]